MMGTRNRKVIAFGTFDVFHKGHENFLKQAKKLGAYLIVVIARDVNVKKIKGKWPKNKETDRLKEVEKSRLADEVTLGNLRNKYGMIKKYKPQVIAIGYDQAVDRIELEKKLLKFNLRNVTIKRLRAYKPNIYKSSKLKQK